MKTWSVLKLGNRHGKHQNPALQPYRSYPTRLLKFEGCMLFTENGRNPSRLKRISRSTAGCFFRPTNGQGSGLIWSASRGGQNLRTCFLVKPKGAGRILRIHLSFLMLFAMSLGIVVLLSLAVSSIAVVTTASNKQEARCHCRSATDTCHKDRKSTILDLSVETRIRPRDQSSRCAMPRGRRQHTLLVLQNKSLPSSATQSSRPRRWQCRD